MLQQAQILMRSGGHDLPIVPRRLLEHDLCALRDRRDAGQLRKYALGALGKPFREADVQVHVRGIVLRAILPRLGRVDVKLKAARLDCQLLCVLVANIEALRQVGRGELDNSPDRRVQAHCLFDVLLARALRHGRRRLGELLPVELDLQAAEARQLGGHVQN